MTCICGHHAHAHAQDVGLCGSPHGCDCSRFVEAKPEPAAPKRFAEMTPMELVTAWQELCIKLDPQDAWTALRDAIRAEAMEEAQPLLALSGVTEAMVERFIAAMDVASDADVGREEGIRYALLAALAEAV